MILTSLAVLLSVQFAISTDSNGGYLRVNNILTKLKDTYPENAFARGEACRNFAWNEPKYQDDAQIWKPICDLEVVQPCTQETLSKYTNTLRDLQAFKQNDVRQVQLVMKSGLAEHSRRCMSKYNNRFDDMMLQNNIREAREFALKLSKAMVTQCTSMLDWCVLRGGFSLSRPLAICLRNHFPKSMGKSLSKALTGGQVTKDDVVQAKSKCQAFVDQFGQLSDLVANTARLANDLYYGTDRVCEASVAVEMCKRFLSQSEDTLASSMKLN